VRVRLVSIAIVTLLTATVAVGAPTGAATRDASRAAVPASITTQDQVPDPPDGELTLTAVNPVVATGDTVQWRGRLVNRTASPWNDVIVEVRIAASPLLGRFRLQRWIDGQGAVTSPVTRVVVPLVPAAGSAGWSIRVPTADLGLGLTEAATGVYAIDIRPRGLPEGTQVASARSFLTWIPVDRVVRPSGVVVLVPLTWTPARIENNLFLNAALAQDISATGRLTRLLTAVAGRRVSWVVDPSLLEAVADLADGARILDSSTAEGERATTPAEEQQAAAWLGRAREAFIGADLHALPAGAADVVAMSSGTDPRGVRSAIIRGELRTGELAGRTPSGTVVWAAAGINTQILSSVREAGVATIVIPDRALPPAPDVFFTPSGVLGAQQDQGRTDARLVLTDSQLSTAISGAGTADAVVAELSMISMELPQAPRTVVLTLPLLASSFTTLSRTLDMLTDPRSARAVLLRTVTDFVPSARGDVPRREPVYPAEDLADVLPDSYLAAVEDVRSRVEVLAGTAARAQDSAEVRESLLSAVDSGRSILWRTDKKGRTAFLDATLSNLATYESQVTVIGADRITLSGDRGVIPVTLRNELPFAVRITLEVVPTSPLRMILERDPPAVTVAPGERLGIELRVRVVGSGDVGVQMRPVSLTGDRVGPPITIQVGTAAYARVATYFVAVAFVLLALLVVRNTVRRVRVRGRAVGSQA
jgi:hypothetical protein